MDIFKEYYCPTICKYYIAIGCKYLYPDLSIQYKCKLSNKYHGWYNSRQEAKEVIEEYYNTKLMYII